MREALFHELITQALQNNGRLEAIFLLHAHPNLCISILFFLFLSYQDKIEIVTTNFGHSDFDYETPRYHSASLWAWCDSPVKVDPNQFLYYIMDGREFIIAFYRFFSAIVPCLSVYSFLIYG